MTFCSAPSRIAQVLMTMRSASSKPAASAQPAWQQPPGHLLGVAAVHLAAERPEVEPRQRPRLGQVLGEPVVGGRAGRRAAPPDAAGGDDSSIGRARSSGRSVGHRSVPGAYDAGEPRTPSATSGGTHSRACASAYVPGRRGSRCRRSATRPSVRGDARRPPRPSRRRTSGSRPRGRRARRRRARGRRRSAPGASLKCARTASPPAAADRRRSPRPGRGPSRGM